MNEDKIRAIEQALVFSKRNIE